LGHALSLALFAAVLGLGFLKPRFWCKYVCPSGAVFSLGNLFRFSERKVESSCIHCNKCVEICPFDAIKADFTTRVCVDECVSAGYFAIDFTRVGTELDPDGNPIEGTGMNAPVVNADACVGCGLCQTRCYGVNVNSKGLLDRSAIVIEAGEGKEDRLSSGSYQALRQHEQESKRPKGESNKPDYLPGFLKP
jgi:Fe-S-cluster-containing hydrogenase component 2